MLPPIILLSHHLTLCFCFLWLKPGVHKKATPPPTHPKPKMDPPVTSAEEPKLSSNRNIASTISKLRGRSNQAVNNNSE